MALAHTDFSLTDDQLRLINEHFEKAALRYAQAGEDPPWGVEIRFSWSPICGRTITAHYDGESPGFEIEF